jgi:hypothetical protein
MPKLALFPLSHHGEPRNPDTPGEHRHVRGAGVDRGEAVSHGGEDNRAKTRPLTPDCHARIVYP